MSQEQANIRRVIHGITIEAIGGHRAYNTPKPMEIFEEACIPDWAAAVMRHLSYMQPTPIQMQAWSAANFGYDMLAIASTGSGKTLAYTLPMIQHVTAQKEVKCDQGPIGLILVPSRELCQQVSQDIKSLLFDARSLDASAPNLRVACVFGGNTEDQQSGEMLGQFDVMVACPGRLLHALDQRHTNLYRASFIVVDEADDLLAEKPSATAGTMDRIFAHIRPPLYRQLLLFSATHQENTMKFAKVHCVSPFLFITVGGTALSACSDVEQHFWPYRLSTYWPPGENKIQALIRALGMIKEKLHATPLEKSLILIFVNRTDTVQAVVDSIRAEGIECSGIHSGLRQEKRDSLLQEFINGDIRCLVSTNLLARGIDVPDIKWVINYDMPGAMTDYVHRIGRTGRGGRKGVALTLLEDLDLRHSNTILDVLNASHCDLKEVAIPQWLSEEAKRYKMYWKRFYNQKRQQTYWGCATSSDPIRPLEHYR